MEFKNPILEYRGDPVKLDKQHIEMHIMEHNGATVWFLITEFDNLVLFHSRNEIDKKRFL